MRECPNCGKAIEKRYNKYCDNSCQGQYQTKLKIEKWLVEGNLHCENKMLHRWAKKYIRERDDNKCIECGISEWQGKPIVLEVDHIDGDYRNNNVNNLRTLCPNCHSQTPTYKNNNIGKGRSSR